ncbi:MAG: DUF4258 domain-containing protein [Fibrobacteraceae bacterium]|nr:DUF4258 domain-containing protein [Fibrobacteraceae bacterium]
MNIKISQHAKERMEQRGISESEIIALFKEERFDRFVDSEKDDSVVIVDKVVNGKKWRFVYNKLTKTIITCFPRR